MWTEIVTRLHASPGNVLVVGGGTLAMILTCLFCWIRGGKADRIGAAVFLGCGAFQFVAACVSIWITGDERPQILVDTFCDILPGLVFLWLAFRHDNLWLGAAALFQGLQLALDTADQVIREPIGTLVPLILILSIDTLNLVILAAMLGSVLSRTDRHRRTTSVQAA